MGREPHSVNESRQSRLFIGIECGWSRWGLFLVTFFGQAKKVKRKQMGLNMLNN